MAAAGAADGKTVAAGLRYGTVRVWDVPARKERATLRGHAGDVWSVAFAPDGKTVAVATDEGVRFADPATGGERRCETGDRGDAENAPIPTPTRDRHEQERRDGHRPGHRKTERRRETRRRAKTQHEGGACDGERRVESRQIDLSDLSRRRVHDAHSRAEPELNRRTRQ